GSDVRDDGAVAGHPGDRHIVRRPATGHGPGCCVRRTSELDIAGCEASDGFTEYDGKVNRRTVGWISLRPGLVDGYRGAGLVKCYAIVSAARGRVGVSSGISGHSSSDCGDNGAVIGHSADRDIVSGPASGHCGRGCARGPVKSYVTRCETGDGLAEDDR